MRGLCWRCAPAPLLRPFHIFCAQNFLLAHIVLQFASVLLWRMWPFATASTKPAPIMEADLAVLPSYFPATTKSCNTISNTFFDCFSANTKKTEALDTEIGDRALKTCEKEHRAYRECMEAALKGTVQDRRFRVSPRTYISAIFCLNILLFC